MCALLENNIKQRLGIWVHQTDTLELRSSEVEVLQDGNTVFSGVLDMGVVDFGTVGFTEAGAQTVSADVELELEIYPTGTWGFSFPLRQATGDISRFSFASLSGFVSLSIYDR